MRYTPALAVLLSACAHAGCASNGVKPVPPPVAPATGASGEAGETGDGLLTLVVYGMGCPLCANNVDKQLLKIAGVRKVDVNLGSGSVKVQYAGTAPSKAQLAKAVADSGYTLVKVEGI